MVEHTITGWLFDLYPTAHGITLWLADRMGGRRRCVFPFAPWFFMHIRQEEEARVAALVRSLPVRVTLAWDRQRELYRDVEWTVLRVTVHDPLALRRVVGRLERHFPHFVFCNSDIPVPQLFLYSTGLFPLARGEYRIDDTDTLTGWTLDDTFDATDYTLPEVTTLTVKNRPDFVSPKYRRNVQLEISYDGTTYSLERDEPVEILDALNFHLRRYDPDVILTEYGDAILMPLLAQLAAEHHRPLALNRDTESGYFTTNATSYFTYGKIVHKDGAFELAGRWHLDTENSFMMSEASLDGVAEIARLTQLPVQHQSRSSIGSALSSMQLSWAFRHGYLIPAKKREPEEFKSAATLLLADRGGVIFQPVIGYHEQIAELDFVSMYPTIMVEHNVSPETVNCRCCVNTAVPELGYSICERREGIVPSTLRAVVKKRSFYKTEKRRLKKLGDERWHLYDRRQNALKWMLVTCFGYLGYKNARFGRIEAHESVNAFSRETILRAKEIAEGRGYTFIHAIVDCMWITRPGADEQEYEQLARDVGREAGIDMSLEGVYSWILFPASKMDPLLPTANRYVGWYTNGEIKIRGVEMRRRDTPVFLKRMQGEMLQLMGGARTVGELREMLPQLLAKAKEWIDVLRSGTANPHELVVRRRLSREAGEYTTRTANAVVARALEEAGVKLAAGESVEYIVVDAGGKRKPEKAKAPALYALDDGYDIEYYTSMALKTAETLLLPFGYHSMRLAEVMGIPCVRRAPRAARRTPAAQQVLDFPPGG